jgi:hypothetical protein
MYSPDQGWDQTLRAELLTNSAKIKVGCRRRQTERPDFARPGGASAVLSQRRRRHAVGRSRVQRFSLGLSDQQKQELVAFLKTL